MAVDLLILVALGSALVAVMALAADHIPDRAVEAVRTWLH